jgi:hypothetical protein
MMDELDARGLGERVYLWSDDNLSNDYFWKYLTDDDRERIASNRSYGRVCCFKGFNEESFSFNTCASPDLFKRQFDLMQRVLTTGIDVYGYVTLTTPNRLRIEDDVKKFLDRIQTMDEHFPLRIVPLQVLEFTPTTSRLDDSKRFALKNQCIAVESWQREMEERFSAAERNENVANVRIRRDVR